MWNEDGTVGIVFNGQIYNHIELREELVRLGHIFRSSHSDTEDLRRVAGCATPSGSAGHAGATADIKLTFHLDHSAGADHIRTGVV
jgi:glutamine phosphoribosylpyrophosphate amidotransferase